MVKDIQTAGYNGAFTVDIHHDNLIMLETMISIVFSQIFVEKEII